MAKSNFSTVPSASLAKALSTVARASGKDPYQASSPSAASMA